jgi:PPM family protein phosphatase
MRPWPDLKAGSWTFSGNGLSVWVRCDQGARRRIEDAWVASLEASLGARRVPVFGVFDGLGGEPKGDVAAAAASTALLSVLERSGSLPDVLARLNEVVLQSGGFTTAVIATVGAAGEVELAHVGDSGAFQLVDGRVTLLTPRDTAPNGSITDFLGNPRLRGHASRTSLARGASLLLCTDGVDGIVGEEPLADLLRATPAQARDAIDRLYAEIHSLGAPDNATIVWIRRD